MTLANNGKYIVDYSNEICQNNVTMCGMTKDGKEMAGKPWMPLAILILSILIVCSGVVFLLCHKRPKKEEQIQVKATKGDDLTSSTISLEPQPQDLLIN